MKLPRTWLVRVQASTAHPPTNTRITVPEVLETHYPVRLDWFEFRYWSGGFGHWDAGAMG